MGLHPLQWRETGVDKFGAQSNKAVRKKYRGCVPFVGSMIAAMPYVERLANNAVV